MKRLIVCVLVSLVSVACQSGSNAGPAKGPDGPCEDANGTHICCGRPGEIQGSNCVSRELAEKQSTGCVAEGNQRSGKTFDPPCCEGLVQVSLTLDKQACAAAPDANVCAKCGDGACGSGEDVCNCPADCK
ncbi:MAG: hypothetical protein H6718_21320 [Polyangiaceae bacterium]|nr:hypothetical protein [Myxococcales bacterium]MCB9587960.1 hypothetical protein [Polyangiaceae bacterium]